MTNFDNFYQMIFKNHKHHLMKNAVVTSSGNQTYEELIHNIGILSNSLNNFISDPKKHVVMTYLDDGMEYVISLLTVTKLYEKLTIFPQSPYFDTNLLQHNLEMSAPPILITSRAKFSELTAKLELLKTDNFTILILEFVEQELKIEMTFWKGNAACKLIDNEELINTHYLLTTSGSTGLPKIVKGRIDSLMHFIQWESELLKRDTFINTLQLAPSSFDVSLRDIFLPLCNSGAVIIPDREEKTNPALLLESISKKNVSVLHIVPSVCRTMLDVIESDTTLQDSIGKLGAILFAGEPLFYRDIERVRQFTSESCRLFNLYGLTETTLAKFCYPIEEVSETSEVVPLGKPLPQTHVIFANDAGFDKNLREGEIGIASKYASNGYLAKKSDAMTSITIEDEAGYNLFATGDLGRLDENGNLHILGRIDDVLKIAGQKVSLLQVESVVKSIDGIENAAIVSDKDEDLNASLHCFYKVQSETSLISDSLRAKLASKLPAHAVPAFFYQKKSLPLLENGKVNKKQLATEMVSSEPITNIQTEPSSELMDCISEALKNKQLNMELSWLENGGSSLAAMKLISRLHKKIKVILSSKLIMESDSITALVSAIKELQPEKNKSDNMVKGSFPLEIPSLQKPFYDISYLEPLKQAYNESVVFTMPVINDLSRLRLLMEHLVENQPALRSVFSVHENKIMQSLTKWNSDSFLFVMDFSGNDDPQQTFNNHFAKIQQHNFDLVQGPLFRCDIIQIDDSTSYFCFYAYHLIIDQWSVDILIDDVLVNYFEGKTVLPQRTKMEQQYLVHAAQLEQDTLRQTPEALIFWKEYLGSQHSVQLIGVDRPEIKTYIGSRFEHTLDTEFSEKITTFAKSNNIELVCFLMHCFASSICKRSSIETINIGLPVSCRIGVSSNSLVGSFINVLAYVHNCTTETNVDVLKETQSQLRRIQKYRLIPFEQIYNALEVAKDWSRSPLFDITFTLIEEKSPVFCDQVLTVQRPDKGTAKYDISCFVYKSVDQISVYYEYNTDVYRHQEIVRIHEFYEREISLVINSTDFIIGS